MFCVFRLATVLLGLYSTLVLLTTFDITVRNVSQEFNVDIAFWGHHHTYQRTCPVYQSVCINNGIPHVIIGMAGRELLPDFE